jgi:hypothetical protein
MSATYMNVIGVIRDLEDDLQRTRDDLKVKIGKIVFDMAIDKIVRSAINEDKLHAKAPVDIDDLINNADEALVVAFADHDWRVTRALRDLRKALDR